MYINHNKWKKNQGNLPLKVLCWIFCQENDHHVTFSFSNDFHITAITLIPPTTYMNFCFSFLFWTWFFFFFFAVLFCFVWDKVWLCDCLNLPSVEVMGICHHAQLLLLVNKIHSSLILTSILPDKYTKIIINTT